MTDENATFADPASYIASYTGLPRITGMVLSPDGTDLVLTVQRPDKDGARYTSSLWQVATDGKHDPIRLTHSAKGESAPAYRPDGSLVFVSARPDADGDGDDAEDAAIWELPARGEARVLARTAGGLAAPVVAAHAGTVVAAGSRLRSSSDPDDDGERRRTRAKRKVNAVLHTGMPIRSWDHEVEDVSPRLLRIDSDAEAGVHDLTKDATHELTDAAYTISADGAMIATTWMRRGERGQYAHGVALVDAVTGARTTLAAEDGVEYSDPTIAPDGARVATIRMIDGDFDVPLDVRVQIHGVPGGDVVTAELGDVFPAECAWSRDSATLFVAGDWHGRGAVLAIDPATGQVLRRLAADAVYSNMCPSPDGASVYALRATIEQPLVPVRLDVQATDQAPAALPTPAPVPDRSGSLVEIETVVDGATVRGWLCLPEPGPAPAPVMTWIHGGPFTSWNAWSWRWNPWVMAAHGWAVLMPDPALSTGYGPEWFARAWPHRAAPVWHDVEALLDAALTRDDLDAERLACLGGSFGGYMTNWIAGNTDRFGAIVTHAGLWALDQQHTTTDHAEWKTGLFGTPAQHPEWYAQNSPHNFADRISTPMLVVHGNRDYRVPVSEALRLWWDLVSRHQGDPSTMAHRFLQFTAENHWVLSPANAQVWYETVLGFCDRHVRGIEREQSALL